MIPPAFPPNPLMFAHIGLQASAEPASSSTPDRGVTGWGRHLTHTPRMRDILLDHVQAPSREDSPGVGDQSLRSARLHLDISFGCRLLPPTYRSRD